MLYLGIDVGSLTCDAALVDGEEKLVAWSVVPTGARNVQAIARARDEVLAASGAALKDVAELVATGYGRDRVDGRGSSVTEITCHARGIRALLPETDPRRISSSTSGARTARPCASTATGSWPSSQ
jgi:activator of 2-hydroxyglutaryl-CoA dehydratase